MKLSYITKHKFFSMRKNNNLLKVVITSIAFFQSNTVLAQEVGNDKSSEKAVFDPSFLMPTSGHEVDVTRFEHGTPLEPGEYLADIYLNNKFIGRESISIRISKGNPDVYITKNVFNRIGVKSDFINHDYLKSTKSASDFYDLALLTSVAKSQFDSSEMRLDINIPQENLQHTARGSVDPSLWDDGANALLLGYNTNYYESVTNNKESQSFYGGTNLGYNINGWMFRHTGALSWQKDTRRKYNTIRNYVQHDITPLKARLTLGDSNTSGDLFDTFAFRGIQLNTVEKMLPDSQRGYAPVVRGVAQTNAHVTIEQNGSLLYDTTVPPGPFVINDLYPTGYGGDLHVKVTEADGRETTFNVPYASVAQLLRPGATYYSAIAGTLRDLNLSYTPRVAQVTLQHGINNSLTAYTGFLGTGNYNSGVAGAAIGTQLGAIALDITHARVSADGNESQGSSYRATFSKMFAETGSSISIAAYRFSSSGYLDLKNAMLFSDHYRYRKNDNNFTLQRPRNRLSLTASQTFSEGRGQIYISGFSQNYWNQTGNDNQYQIGYNNSIGRVTYSLSANRLKNISGNQETQYLLTLSLPLGQGNNAPSLNMNMGHTSEGFNSQVSLNGLLGQDQQFNYNVAAARDENNDNSGSVSGVYRSPYSTLQGTYGQSDNYHAFSAGANGSVVILSDSITASPYTSDTLGVISAPDAKGAKVEGYSGVFLNDYGNALVPYLNSYRLNEVSLNPKGLPMDVELQSTSQQVTPRSGAIVRLKYRTTVGKPVLISLKNIENELPLGTVVKDRKGNAVGSVAQGGLIYARLPDAASELTIKWGEGKTEGCRFRVNLPGNHKAEADKTVNFYRIDSQCL